MKYLSSLLALLLTTSAVAVDNTSWYFVVVVSNGIEWSTVKGPAQVTWKGAKFTAEMHGEDTSEFRLAGTVTRNIVKATFNALETDTFVNAPFSGHYSLKRHYDIAPCGIEIITLTDGYNFIGLRRNFHDEKCRP